MDDLISREEALKAACKGFCKPGIYCPDCGCKELDPIKNIPAAERWIPVSEWLPELGVEVLTYTENDGLIEIQSRVGTDLWENRHGDLQELRTVTAWMPKPKPYRKEGEL